MPIIDFLKSQWKGIRWSAGCLLRQTSFTLASPAKIKLSLEAITSASQVPTAKPIEEGRRRFEGRRDSWAMKSTQARPFKGSLKSIQAFPLKVPAKNEIVFIGAEKKCKRSQIFVFK